MPATINMYSESDQLTAPLASVEDLSRVNTPGGSPSPHPRRKHPALEDPNWEPPEEPLLPKTKEDEKPVEVASLQQKPEKKSNEPVDRLVL